MEIGILFGIVAGVSVIAAMTASICAWVFLGHAVIRRKQREFAGVRKESSSAMTCGLTATCCEGLCLGYLFCVGVTPLDVLSYGPVPMAVLVALGPLPFTFAWLLSIRASRPGKERDPLVPDPPADPPA